MHIYEIGIMALAALAWGIAALFVLVVVFVATLSLRSWIGAPYDARRIYSTIEKHFAFLVHEGEMQRVERSYYWKHFGNVVIRYEGPTFYALLVRDRLLWEFRLGCTGPRRVEYELRTLLSFLADPRDAEIPESKQNDPVFIGDLASRYSGEIFRYLKTTSEGSDRLSTFVR